MEGYEGETISATVDGQLRTVKKGLNPCQVCAHDFLIEEPEQIHECCIDRSGGLACKNCAGTLNKTFEIGKHRVCLNVLCRRKWKQMVPHKSSFFCVPCRRHMDTIDPNFSHEKEQMSTIAHLQHTCRYWASVLKVLSTQVPFECSRLKDQPSNAPAFGPEDDLQRTIDVFTATFSQFHVPAEWFRNWNSMLDKWENPQKTKKFYRGRIDFKHPETGLCHIDPTCEIEENFTPTHRELKRESYPFFVLDRGDGLELGAEVYFFTFLNPVYADWKDCFKHIVKMIPGPQDSPMEEGKSSPSTPSTVAHAPPPHPKKLITKNHQPQPTHAIELSNMGTCDDFRPKNNTQIQNCT